MPERRARLDQPKTPGRNLRPQYDAEAFGRLTERVARFLGTGRYLVVQTIQTMITPDWRIRYRPVPKNRAIRSVSRPKASAS